MCPTACRTDFDPGRRSRANSAACVGRSRAMPNSTATKKPLAATSTNARMTPPAIMGSAYGTRRASAAMSGSDGRFGRVGVRHARADVGRVLVGAGDQLVARLAVVLGQEAGLHAEVHRLRVVGDERDRRLLGLDRVAAAQPQPDRGCVEQAEDLLVLGLLRARRVAPRVAPALAGLDAEILASARVQPLRHALGGLHAEAVGEELLGELAVGLELRHQLRDLVAGGDRLQRDDVELAAVLRAEEVGQADAVVLGLAREDEALEHGRAVLGIEYDDLVALAVAGEVAEHRARV